MPSRNSHRVVLLTALAWAGGLFGVSFALRLVINQINLASNYGLDPFFGGYFHTLLIGPTAGGALAGYWTARLFKRYADLPCIRILPTVLVWAVAMLLIAILPFLMGQLLMASQDPQSLSGDVNPTPAVTPPFIQFLLFVLDLLLWFTPGALGGLQLGREIRRGGLQGGLRISGGSLALIAASWGFGFAVGGLLGRLVGSLSFEYLLGPQDPGWLITEFFIWQNYGLTGLVAGAVGGWVTVQVIWSSARASTGTAAGIQVPGH